jgi:hypothetical protein
VAITVPNVVKVTGSGVTSVTTSGVTTTTGGTFIGSTTADDAVTINAPTDSKSNSYGTAKATVSTGGSSSKQAVYVKENGAGGAGHTLTFTYGSATYPTAFFIECAGAAVASYDAGSLASGASGSGQPFARNSAGQAQLANAILTFCAVDAGTNPLTYSNTGYTVSQEQDGGNFWTGAVGRQIVSQTGAVTSSWAVAPGATNGGTITFAIKEATSSGTNVDPAQAAIALTGQTPTVAQSANQSVAPAQDAIAITGQTPSIVQNQQLAPAQDAIALTGPAPSIVQNQNLAPAQDAIAITGQTPSIVQDSALRPAQGAITLTGPAPSIVQNQNLVPAQGAVVLTGPAPTLAQTANQAVAPAQGAIALTGPTPTIAQTGGQALNPAQGEITLVGPVPTVAQTGNQSVNPAEDALVLAGPAPTITQTTGQGVAPGAGTIALAGPVPSVAQTASVVIDPPAGQVTITGRAPTIAQSQPSTSASALRRWLIQVYTDDEEKRKRKIANEAAKEIEQASAGEVAIREPEPVVHFTPEARVAEKRRLARAEQRGLVANLEGLRDSLAFQAPLEIASRTPQSQTEQDDEDDFLLLNAIL